MFCDKCCVFVGSGLWKEWLKDELPLSSLSDGIEELSKLFERAVSDYICECVREKMCKGD